MFTENYSVFMMLYLTTAFICEDQMAKFCKILQFSKGLPCIEGHRSLKERKQTALV